MRADDELQRPVVLRGVGERNPGSDETVRVGLLVRGVSVPHDAVPGAWLADEEVDVTNENRLAEEPTHGIEKARVTNQFVGPSEKGVVMADIGVDVAFGPMASVARLLDDLNVLQPTPEPIDLGGVEYGDRGQIPALVKGADIGGLQRP